MNQSDSKSAKELIASRAQLPIRWMVQPAHLTCPATVWQYAKKAVLWPHASMVMLDLEDSIPRGDVAALEQGRGHVISALNELNWGGKLRFFRPRGLALDPGFEDVFAIVKGAGKRLEGLVYPKVDGPEEVALLDEALAEAEKEAGLREGHVKIELLIESVLAETKLSDIAQASGRTRALIFGAFDYWGSLGQPQHRYRPDHPLIMDARCAIVKAAAVAGVPAIAEMTLNYPTKTKSPAEQKRAIEECRSDALLAKDCGFSGKWAGMPAQAEVVLDVFKLEQEVVDRAVAHVRAFAAAEQGGRGAVMIDGKMADRATDRIAREVLRKALALGQLTEETAQELGVGSGRTMVDP